MQVYFQPKHKYGVFPVKRQFEFICEKLEEKTESSAKGQTKSKWFFQANVSTKKRTNEFDFTTMICTLGRLLRIVT